MPSFALASGHTKTTEVMETIVRDGGNLFDAIVGGGFASTLAEPMLSSLGGGGYLVGKKTTIPAFAYDFFPATPGLGKNTNDLNPQFFEIEVHFSSTVQPFHVGPGSIAVPSALKGLLQAHEDLGSLPLKAILDPVIEMARTGIRLNRTQAYALELLYPIHSGTDTGKALFSREGKPLPEGELLRNPALADFLETLPTDKGRNFYQGELGRKLTEELASQQGLLTSQDLASYEVKRTQAQRHTINGLELYSHPLPAVGGLLVLLSAQLYHANRNSTHPWHSPQCCATIAQILQSVETLKAKDLERLESLTPESIEKLLNASIRSKGGTTHLSAGDSDGNIAALSLSNGEGSGVFVPDTGIMLNNMLGEEDLHPEGFHAVPPGKRMASMMAPLIVKSSEPTWVALGSGGSKRIRSALFQVLVSHFFHGVPLQQSVEQPRLHWEASHLHLEPGLTPESISLLKSVGSVRQWQSRDLYFGGVHAVIGGELAVGDPRREGVGTVVQVAR